MTDSLVPLNVFKHADTNKLHSSLSYIYISLSNQNQCHRTVGSTEEAQHFSIYAETIQSLSDKLGKKYYSGFKNLRSIAVIFHDFNQNKRRTARLKLLLFQGFFLLAFFLDNVLLFLFHDVASLSFLFLSDS